MTNANRARYLHRLLDLLVDKRDIGVRNIEKLRAELPEIPKQKTLEDLCQEVYDVWAGAHGNEWPDDVHVDLETWLDELHTQLKGLTPAKPAHSEFLETEADYAAAPEGTIAARSGQIPWAKESDKQWSCISGAVGNYSMAQNKPRRVLRWGWA